MFVWKTHLVNVSVRAIKGKTLTVCSVFNL